MPLMELFMISVGTALVCEIIHSAMVHGRKFTISFFGIGYLVGFIRELLYVNVFDEYAFTGLPLSILGVPPVVPAGWVFAWYLGYEVVRRKLPPGEDFAICGAFFADVICIPIESAALNCGWWVVPLSEGLTVASPHLMLGWFYTTLLWFYCGFAIRRKIHWKKLGVVVALLWFVYTTESGIQDGGILTLMFVAGILLMAIMNHTAGLLAALFLAIGFITKFLILPYAAVTGNYIVLLLVAYYIVRKEKQRKNNQKGLGLLSRKGSPLELF